MDLHVMDTDFFLIVAGLLLILGGAAILMNEQPDGAGGEWDLTVTPATHPFFWPGLGTMLLGAVLLGWGVFERVSVPSSDAPIKGPENER